MPVREGLARLEGVESISERCDRKRGTGELRMRQGRLIHPQKLAEHIYNIRVGARLRGLEGTVAGAVWREGEKLMLRVAGTNTIFELAPLTRKVQIDALNSKKPEPLSNEEKEAFNKLFSKAKRSPKPVQITGPLNGPTNAPTLRLEVRQFSFERRTPRF